MKNTLLLIIVSLLVTSCMSKPAALRLRGTMDNVGNKTVVVSYFKNETRIVLDSFKLKNNHIDYTTKLNTPAMMCLQVKGIENAAEFYGENTDYTVKGDVNNISELQFTGGKLFKEYNEYAKLDASTVDKANRLGIIMNKAHKENNKATVDSVTKAWSDISESIKSKKLELVTKHPSSPVSVLVVYQLYAHQSYAKIKLGLSKLDSSLKDNFFYKKLVARMELLEKTAIGHEAPLFTAKTPNGKDVSLKSYRGRVVLIDFWASWCYWCKKETPEVEKVYKKYHNQGFDVLSVSLDSKKDLWVAAVKKDKLPWTQISDLKAFDSPICKMYGITGIPQLYLIGKDGKIVAENLRGAKAIGEAVAKALK